MTHFFRILEQLVESYFCAQMVFLRIHVAGELGLTILSQPEQQHRARYQTEGSRGAVKDRSGNGFPVVQLVGYHKPATLQVGTSTLF